MSLYQIALYPFELRVNGYHALAVQQRLDAVFGLFRTGQPLTTFVHESLEIDTPPCVIRVSTDKSMPVVEVEVKSANADLTQIIDHAEPEIVNHAVRESTGLLWIHGACLVRGDERILLVAETTTGKTTLSLGLLTQGFQLITDDIILIDLENRQIIPMPRCPKVRPPAPDYLCTIGFDLTRDAQMQGRYVLLPPERFFTQPVPASIDRVYLLHRHVEHISSADMFDLTSGILSLLHSSNLLSFDPALTMAHDLFANTTFIDMHLGNFTSDLQHIASGVVSKA